MSEDKQCRFADKELMEMNCWRKEEGLDCGDVGCLVCCARFFGENSRRWMTYAMGAGVGQNAPALYSDLQKDEFVGRVFGRLVRKLDPEGFKAMVGRGKELREKQKEEIKTMRRILEGGGMQV